MVSGDFNGDGIDDLATIFNRTGEVQFLINDGTGNFAKPKAGQQPAAVSLSDKMTLPSPRQP